MKVALKERRMAIALADASHDALVATVAKMKQIESKHDSRGSTVPKLFLVQGVRHSAVVLASSQDQAIRLADQASGNEPPDPRVLFGHVQDWESPDATELKLPEGYALSPPKTGPAKLGNGRKTDARQPVK